MIIILILLAVLLFLLFTFYGNPDPYIVENLRIPRNTVAFLCGGGLALSGAVYQTILKNPLAEPYILGVAGFILLGYTIGKLFKVEEIGLAISSVVAVLSVLYISKRLPPKHMLLVGVGVNAFSVSAVLVLYSFLDPYSLKESVTKTIGVVPYVSIWIVFIISLITFVVFSLLMLRSRNLDLLSVGELEAVSFGVNPLRERVISLGLTTILTALFVSLVGLVGFIGLVVPHIVRFIRSSVHSSVLPLSFLTGGIIFMGSDFLARTVMYPAEIPAGVFSSLMLSPLFIGVVWRLKHD